LGSIKTKHFLTSWATIGLLRRALFLGTGKYFVRKMFYINLAYMYFFLLQYFYSVKYEHEWKGHPSCVVDIFFKRIPCNFAYVIVLVAHFSDLHPLLQIALQKCCIRNHRIQFNVYYVENCFN
jgi:hypothetical protein